MGKIEIRVPETEEELEQAQQAKDEAWHFLNPERAGSVRGAYESFREGFLTAFMDGKAAGNFILTRVDYDITKPSDKNWEELCLNNFMERVWEFPQNMQERELDIGWYMQHYKRPLK